MAFRSTFPSTLSRPVASFRLATCAVYTFDCRALHAPARRRIYLTEQPGVQVFFHSHLRTRDNGISDIGYRIDEASMKFSSVATRSARFQPSEQRSPVCAIRINTSPCSHQQCPTWSMDLCKPAPSQRSSFSTASTPLSPLSHPPLPTLPSSNPSNAKADSSRPVRPQKRAPD